jgi:hypothetical protein
MRSVVLISCPRNGDLVATGTTADVLDELAPLNVLDRCQSCGERHEWTRDEAAITVTTEV